VWLKTTKKNTMGARIFVSYARSDATIVGQIVRFLNVAGFDTWFDLHELLPGEEWRFVIEREIAKARLLILCLSSNSVNKTGFFQKELRLALEQAGMRPQGEVFIMPIRLNVCPIPTSVAHLQVLDLFTMDATQKLLKAIQKATGDGARVPKEEHAKLTNGILLYNVDPKT
jgi:hypothetical protein